MNFLSLICSIYTNNLYIHLYIYFCFYLISLFLENYIYCSSIIGKIIMIYTHKIKRYSILNYIINKIPLTHLLID